MVAVIQRVKSASVEVEQQLISKINSGVLTLLGIEKGDSEKNLQKLVEKIINYRIFEDLEGKMNLSLKDKNLQHLIVSQFTLAADTDKGRRPSFTTAEDPKIAEQLYLQAIEFSNKLGVESFGGEFQADMKVSLINDGPVTFILRS